MSTVRNLLSALHDVGWRHTTHRQPPLTDLDGAQLSDDLQVHRWTRGNEVITVWLDGPDSPSSHILYELDGNDGALPGAVTVGIDWVQARGFAALWRLADVVGVTSR